MNNNRKNWLSLSLRANKLVKFIASYLKTIENVMITNGAQTQRTIGEITKQEQSKHRRVLFAVFGKKPVDN